MSQPLILEEGISTWFKRFLADYSPPWRATFLTHLNTEIQESAQARTALLEDNTARIQAEYYANMRRKEHDINHKGLVKKRNLVKEVMRKKGEL